MELKDFSVHGTYKYWPIEDTQYDGRVVTRNVKMWTLTVHEPACRYAKQDKNGTPVQDYFGSDGLQNLAARGLTPPTSLYNGSVWQGCKVCHTASLPNADWKATAQKVIDAKRAAEIRTREEFDRRDAIENAKHAYQRAQREARHEWIEAHAAEIDAVELAAAAAWVAANPEQAKLLDQ